jgi:molybdenum-dependent DNA-binding transcriptional regulator ModE
MTASAWYLFELYQKLSGEMFVDDKKRGKGEGAEVEVRAGVW